MLRPRIIEDRIIPLIESAMTYHDIFDVILFNNYVVRGYGNSVITGYLCGYHLYDGDLLSCTITGGIFENCLFYDCIISNSTLINCVLVLSEFTHIKVNKGCTFEYCTRSSFESSDSTDYEINIPEDSYDEHDFAKIRKIEEEFSEFYSFVTHTDPFSSVRFEDYHKQRLLTNHKKEIPYFKSRRECNTELLSESEDF